MISFVLIVCLFTFVTSKSFHPNQHLPVQKYDSPFRYQPFQYYPSPTAAATLPFYRPTPTKEGITDESNEQQLSDLERQYQQWQIAVSNGQQPGVVWISAPQYSYYPPPSGSPPNYPPHYPPQPYPPYPLPPPSYNNTQIQIQEANPTQVNPTQARETVNPSTKPNAPETTAYGSTTPSENITLSPIETVPTSPPSTYSPTTEGTTLPAVENTTYYSTTTSKATISSSTPVYTTSTTPKESVTTTTRVSITTTIEPVTNATTEIPTTEYTTQGTSPTTTQNSTSVETTTTPQNTTGNATNPLLKYCKKPRGQFPNEDCSKFVNCWDDTAVEQACPSGLYFNANKSYCDYPENVECSGSSSSSSTESTTSSSSPSSNTTSSKCPTAYGTYRNTSNCAAFYVCVAGEPVDFYCPPGTNYNDELKVCDYPYRVNCSGIPSLPIPEESSTTIVTETTPSNSTSSSSSTTPLYTTESSTSASTSSSTSYSTVSSTSTTESVINGTTTEPSTSTIPPPQVTEEPIPSLPPPTVDPVALYNFNLKKLPESVVNTGVRCYHTNIFRLTPDCSSVTVCQDGLTYIVNCGQGTSFDAFSQKCVSSFRARC